MEKIKVLRSMLFVPVTKPKFFVSAPKSGADGIILDLEDSVPLHEKEKGRQAIKEAISAVGVGGADVLVRINNDSDHLLKDLDACVWPGLDGIMIPKVEKATDITLVDRVVSQFEKKRNLEAGSVYLEIDFETAKGIVNAQDIIPASPRVLSVGFGAGDYCRDVGIVPSSDGRELLYAFSRLITLAKAMEVQAKGILGTIVDVQDLESFEQMAIKARNLGSDGSPCIHPKQVEILNRVFSPSRERIEWAENVIEAFEKGSQEGIGASVLDGKMIDYGSYRHAKAILNVAKAVEAKEQGMKTL